MKSFKPGELYEKHKAKLKKKAYPLDDAYPQKGSPAKMYSNYDYKAIRGGKPSALSAKAQAYLDSGHALRDNDIPKSKKRKSVKRKRKIMTGKEWKGVPAEMYSNYDKNVIRGSKVVPLGKKAQSYLDSGKTLSNWDIPKSKRARK